MPHHPVINPNKHEKVSRVCSAAAKYESVALNDNFLSNTDLLHILSIIIFCIREHQKPLSPNIEAILLQVAVPSDDSRCLQFIWREDPLNKIEVYEYTRHVWGRRARLLVQVTLCIKWRKITRKTTNVSSERISETSTLTTSSSQSKHLSEQSKSINRSGTSSTKVDPI